MRHGDRCPLSNTSPRSTQSVVPTCPLALTHMLEHLGANQISPASKEDSLVHLQNMPHGSCPPVNPVEQRSPPPHPQDCAEHVSSLPLFPLSLSLMFMDFLSIHMKAVGLNNDEVLPSTWHSHSLIVSASLELFKYRLFIIIKRGDLLPGALCWHLWIPKKAKYFDFLLLFSHPLSPLGL